MGKVICKNCCDTGRTIMPNGEHSEYMDCTRCDVATHIAAGRSSAIQAAAELDRINCVLYAGCNYALRQGAEALRKLAAT